MKKNPASRRLILLHRAFWSVYAFSSAVFVPACGFLVGRLGLGPSADFAALATAYMAFQQALFVIFTRLEGFYPRQNGSPGFLSAVALSSLAVAGLLFFLAGGGYLPFIGGDYPPGLPGLAYGNIACALSLSTAFLVFRVVSRRKPIP